MLAEFPDEVEGYLAACQQYGSDPEQTNFISLHPKLHIWLRQRGLEFTDSQPFFNTEAHARALNKSDELLQWLEARTNLEDSLGISKAYNNGLIWYCRYFLHHMLWLSEIIAEVQRQNPQARIIAPLSESKGTGSPFVQDNDRYLGSLAKSFCEINGLDFVPIDFHQAEESRSNSRRKFRSVRGPIARLGAAFHRAAIGRMGRQRPLALN